MTMYCLEYNHNHFFYRLFFVCFTLLLTCSTVQPRYILLNNGNIKFYNNKSLFNAVHIKPDSGLNTILDFIKNSSTTSYPQQQRYVSVLNEPSNNILNSFMESMGSNNVGFHHFDINSLKMQYLEFEEQEITYQESINSRLVELLNKNKTSELCILTHNCVHEVINRLLHQADSSKSVRGYCYHYNPFAMDYEFLNVLDAIKVSPCTHIMFLLNLFELEAIFTRLSWNIDFPEYIQFITLLNTQHYSSQNFLDVYGEIFDIINFNVKDAPANENMPIIRNLALREFDKLVARDSMKTNDLKTSISDQLRIGHLNDESYSYDDDEEKCIPEYSVSPKYENHVRATTILYSPFNVIVQQSQQKDFAGCARGHTCKVPYKNGNRTSWKCACCDGISISTFHLISKELGFTYELYVTEDNKYGGSHNGTWNGMIGELIQNKADIAVHGIFLNKERLREVKFTEAFSYSGLAFVRRRNKDKPRFINWEFVETMHFNLAIGILVSTISSVIFIALFENIGYLCSTKSHFALREVMTYIFGLTFQKDMGGRNPKNWSGRIVAIGYACAMMIVMTTYTAHITATNIKQNSDDGFRGLKDQRVLHPTEAFKFAVMRDTSMELFFKDNERNHWKDVWKFIKYYSVTNNTEGIEKVNKGDIDAYLSDGISLLPIVAKPEFCSRLSLYQESSSVRDVAFAYRKDFLIGDEISKAIMTLRESFIVRRFEKRWTYTPTCETFSKDDTQFDFNYFGGIVIIFVIVTVLCIPVILLENIWTHCKENGYLPKFEPNNKSYIDDKACYEECATDDVIENSQNN